MTIRMRSNWSLASRLALAAAAITLSLVHSPNARADQMLRGITSAVYGSAADTISFDTTGAGTVTAQITSIPWPSPLAALSFSATTATSTLDSWSSSSPSSTPQVETFQVGGAGTYFAHVMATAGANPYDLGMYSLMLTFTPSAVPLPAAAGLFLIGIIILAALRGTMRAPRNESVMSRA